MQFFSSTVSETVEEPNVNFKCAFKIIATVPLEKPVLLPISQSFRFLSCMGQCYLQKCPQLGGPDLGKSSADFRLPL